MFLADAYGRDLCFCKEIVLIVFQKIKKVGLRPTLSANRKMKKVLIN